MNNTLESLVSQITTVHNTIQSEAIKSVSKSLTLRNWLIGYYIIEYEQNGADRANYGDKVIESLAYNLRDIKGMSQTNLRLFRQFYFTYPQIHQAVPDEFRLSLRIHQALPDELKNNKLDIFKLLNICTFTHFIELIKIDNPLKRLFYEVEAIKGNWSTRELQRQINSQTFERIGLSHDKKELMASIEMASEKLLPQQIIKDPYILEFTGLETKAKYSENDLEMALLNHLQDFLQIGRASCRERV